MTPICDQALDISITPPRLIAGRSRISGEIKFPMHGFSNGDEYEAIHLKRNGTLWAYTIQRFPPGSPYIGVRDKAEFKPFGVGYVELEGQIIVETRIVSESLDDLKLGMPMTLTTDTFARGDGQGDVITFAFSPSQEVSS